ncbi:ATP-binding protein [Agromyces larvae]|uniref:ATP-binding protein n=1 Tax=Agromyces larvae TaxID=2929802 RepID=A0ABY4BWM8_9MICO|nr:ATP-binding protein [Agromyces larvae]UOE43154.1 ATP-binding protein [Agromyces larvae]
MESFRSNPFRPGAGRVPPELAGRDVILGQVAGVMEQVIEASEGDRPIVISGLRGVGKTVLLNEFVRNATESRRWIAVKVEAIAGGSLRKTLAQALHLELRKLATPGEQIRDQVARLLRVFRSFQLTVDPAGTYSFGFTVEAMPGRADTGDFERDILDLFEELGLTARDLGMGVLVAIDELQDAPKTDLNGLNVALHTLGQAPRPVPIVFIGAGLPSLPSVLADATSYAERLYDYRHLGLLNDAETTTALTKPAEARGVEWEESALVAARRAIGGYPYFAQACGKHVWDARAVPDRITDDDARVGIELARDEVDRGLYQSRWDRATPAQRDMMKAMAKDKDRPSAIQDLVQRTGKSRTSDLSVSRNELIKNGHIYSPDRGYVAFTVPGMADFIARKHSD